MVVMVRMRIAYHTQCACIWHLILVPLCLMRAALMELALAQQALMRQTAAAQPTHGTRLYWGGSSSVSKADQMHCAVQAPNVGLAFDGPRTAFEATLF
jgi:hypothetical protein